MHDGRAQVWADLGAGSGLFTTALSALLPDNSMVVAVDTMYTGNEQIDSKNPLVSIQTIRQDFTALSDLEPCDGILMANSLHYVADKIALLNNLQAFLTASGRLIVVEYDSDNANPWVPYPIAFKNLQDLCNAAGMGIAEKIAQTTSRYQAGGMYSAVIFRNNSPQTIAS